MPTENSADYGFQTSFAQMAAVSTEIATAPYLTGLKNSYWKVWASMTFGVVGQVYVRIRGNGGRIYAEKVYTTAAGAGLVNDWLFDDWLLIKDDVNAVDVQIGSIGQGVPGMAFIYATIYRQSIPQDLAQANATGFARRN